MKSLPKSFFAGFAAPMILSAQFLAASASPFIQPWSEAPPEVKKANTESFIGCVFERTRLIMDKRLEEAHNQLLLKQAFRNANDIQVFVDTLPKSAFRYADLHACAADITGLPPARIPAAPLDKPERDMSVEEKVYNLNAGQRFFSFMDIYVDGKEFLSGYDQKIADYLRLARADFMTLHNEVYQGGLSIYDAP